MLSIVMFGRATMVFSRLSSDYSGGTISVVALWEAFYVENKRFDLGTLRVCNRSPTPISKSNDLLGQSDDIWGARGPHFRTILGVPEVRAGLKHIV